MKKFIGSSLGAFFICSCAAWCAPTDGDMGFTPSPQAPQVTNGAANTNAQNGAGTADPYNSTATGGDQGQTWNNGRTTNQAAQPNAEQKTAKQNAATEMTQTGLLAPNSVSGASIQGPFTLGFPGPGGVTPMGQKWGNLPPTGTGSVEVNITTNGYE